MINLTTVDQFFDGPQESAYFGWFDDAPRRLLPNLEDTTVLLAVATVSNAAYRLFRGVVQRVVKPHEEELFEERGTLLQSELRQEQEQEQDQTYYTDDFRLK